MAIILALPVSGSEPAYDDDPYHNPYYNSEYKPPVKEHWVKPYRRSDGTKVEGHYRTNRDDSFYNNWTTEANRNPHTGAPGTRRPPDDGVRGGGADRVILWVLLGLLFVGMYVFCKIGNIKPG